MNRSRIITFVIVLLLVLSFPPVPASSYVFNFPSGSNGAIRERWPATAFPVTWRLNPSSGSNISGGRTLAEVIQASFATWLAAPNTTLSVMQGANTTNQEGNDGVNVICFTCSKQFENQNNTFAVTLTTSNTNTGNIVDADILFNPAKNFATDSTGTGQDLQTIATHEIGHFFGLGHTAVVRAMMFPFAPDVEHKLGYDDVAAISTLYPSATKDYNPGSIAGTVKLGSSGVFGAHVFASSTTGDEPLSGFNIRKTPISVLSFPDGTYKIEGVPADSYTVTAEPLDLPVTNSDVPDFAPAFGRSAVQTNFTTRWH